MIVPNVYIPRRILGICWRYSWNMSCCMSDLEKIRGYIRGIFRKYKDVALQIVGTAHL